MVVGASAATLIHPRSLPSRVRFYLLTLLCPILPDLDVIGFSFGIPYHHPFGHRGFFHSWFFALIIGIAAGILYLRKTQPTPKQIFRITAYFVAISSTHGLLDAMTDGGLGIALFSPFDNQRYFLPIRPIKVSPIGLSGFLSYRGAQVILSEMLWVWTPCLALAAGAVLIRRRKS